MRPASTNRGLLRRARAAYDLGDITCGMLEHYREILARPLRSEEAARIGAELRRETGTGKNQRKLIRSAREDY